MPASTMYDPTFGAVSLPPSMFPTGNGSPGSNQFFPNAPTMPSPGNTSMATPNFADGNFFGNPTSINPFSTTASPTSTTATATSGSQPLQFTGPPGASGMTGIGKGLFSQNPMDPALTSQFFQWLQSQIGQGVPGFNQSTQLPSGGQTAPGQLNAPFNPLMQSLMKLFSPGGSIGNIAQNGISAIPAWQATVDAMQKQIGEGAANMREQFGFAGNLDSSAFGNSLGDYFTQSNKDLNSLLANMTFQGVQDQLQAASQSQGFGQFTQGLDQQAIQNQLQEFMRTSPQYNPLLGMLFGASTTFPPVLNPKSGAGLLGSLLSSAGPMASGLAQLIPAIAAL